MDEGNSCFLSRLPRTFGGGYMIASLYAVKMDDVSFTDEVIVWVRLVLFESAWVHYGKQSSWCYRYMSANSSRP